MAENNANTNANKEKEVVKISFPRNFPRKIFIRRRPRIGNLPGQEHEDSKQKIGSSYKGSSVNRGITLEEEKRWLKQILSLSPESPNWELATEEYWKNISRPVPAGDGLELEVGLRYENEEDYKRDLNTLKNENGVVVNPKGNPINIADYILYRYCLGYVEVANSFDLVGMSPKINFYIYSKEKEIQEKKISQNQKRDAYQLLYGNLSDRNWVDYMLRCLIDSNSKYTIKDLSTKDDDEKDILLEETMNRNPSKFIAFGKDKNLELKALIELAIAIGALGRISNTATVTMDGVTIGNDLDEAVAFFNNPKNAQALGTVKAQTKVLPS